jgi:pimeloyl-ACP methyl ester carboxylesterase
VLVHGLLGSAFCWRSNLQALGMVRTVYALDMPGLGYSGRIAARECSLKTNAERLLAFMTACGIERADLLGSSHGGAIVLMASALAPERVNRLLLIAPLHPWMRERRLLISMAASTPGALVVRALEPQLAKLHDYFLRRMYADPARIAPGTLEGYSAPMQIPGTLDHLLAIVRCWNRDMQELAEVLPELRPIPTLLLWGSRDKAVRPSAGGMLARFFQDCDMQVIFGAGHLPFEEFPEEFNSRVVTYLNRREPRL